MRVLLVYEKNKLVLMSFLFFFIFIFYLIFRYLNKTNTIIMSQKILDFFSLIFLLYQFNTIIKYSHNFN